MEDFENNDDFATQPEYTEQPIENTEAEEPVAFEDYQPEPQTQDAYDDFGYQPEEPIEQPEAEQVDAMPAYQSSSSYDAAYNALSGPLSDWRDKHDKELKKRAEESAAKKEQLAVKAKEYLDSLYAERKTNMEKAKSLNREQEEATVQDLDGVTPEGGNPWESISKLLPQEQQQMTLNKEKPKKKDVSRMKQVIIHVKNEIAA